MINHKHLAPQMRKADTALAKLAQEEQEEEDKSIACEEVELERK
jgi:hypothetical protein